MIVQYSVTLGAPLYLLLAYIYRNALGFNISENGIF